MLSGVVENEAKLGMSIMCPLCGPGRRDGSIGMCEGPGIPSCGCPPRCDVPASWGGPAPRKSDGPPCDSARSDSSSAGNRQYCGKICKGEERLPILVSSFSSRPSGGSCCCIPDRSGTGHRVSTASGLIRQGGLTHVICAVWHRRHLRARGSMSQCIGMRAYACRTGSLCVTAKRSNV